MVQDLYVILLRPVIARTFGSFKMVVGDECAMLDKVDALVAKEWDIASSFCDCSKTFINGGGRLWLMKS